jgi:hypothetical protein
MRAVVAAAVVAGAVVAGCTNETGLPDLDAVGPGDFPVGETVVLGAAGCSPTAVEIEAGETVVMRAEVDGAFADSDDHRYVTGEMRAGEETHWIMSAPAEIEFECGGERGTDEGTIEVTAQPGP